ncbi:hypothetical protein XI06_15270 [Bradyrhizobium sp. CCBAU 11434]|uniref:hypothetical protein n=1 Tax=Bradyrhizobium sp. CCBAU 11434 TaxID=1630885 RepID=UPI00230627DE|nr:hypothetical protein [Bradyrhizobium sp. CCBAU 11434]MDA9521664.1 hypothetical protein [Bradyrhizobium sp. CCBAU 11434]
MIMAKLLISLALVFIALSLASAMTLGRRSRQPSAKHPSFGYARAELEALTSRADARAAADPLGLRRPLFFSSARSPSAGEADGGGLVQPGYSAVRSFSVVRGGRDG